MLIGLLCLVTGDVVHAVLDNLFLEVGLLLRPGTECAAQAVHRQGRITGNFLERLQHGVVRYWAVEVAPGENVLVDPLLIHLAKDGERLSLQRCALLLLFLVPVPPSISPGIAVSTPAPMMSH